MQKYFEKVKIWGKEHWPTWLLVLISAVVYRSWLSFGIFTHADYWFWFSETSRDFLHYSAWDSQISLGSSNLFLWMWAWKILPAFFGAFNFNSNVADKFVIFWPLIFLTPLFSYLFAKQVLKNKTGAFVSALVFSFNTYYLAINTQGHFSLSLAGTFAPLAMYFFWRYFDTGKKKNLIASALACLFVGAYDFRVFYILFFILLFVPFWFLLAQKGMGQRRTFFRQNFFAMALFFCLILLFNLFWLMPTAMTGSLAGNDILARDLVGNNFSLDITKTLTLFHPFWNGVEPVWFDTQKIPIYFWLIPMMAILGAYWNRRNKKIIFWFVVALFAVFVSKQDALPLKSAYVWLHGHFPGFNAFREASKFYVAILLAYSILIGAFVAYISEHYAKKKYLKWSVFLGASLIFLWNAKPILSGEMHRMFTPQKIAEDELKIRDYQFSQDGSFRTLWNPSDSKWASFSAYRPKINEIETRRDRWKKIKDYAGLQGGEPGGGEKNQLFFSENFASRLLSQSAVRYLISDKGNLFMVENLLSNPEWKRIDLGLEGKLIFENEKVRPRIYLTNETETIHREVAFQSVVDLSMENSSRWNFTLKKSADPVWLNFSESYHPDWQVVCGDTSWYVMLLKKNVFSPENHRATDAGLNAFLLNSSELQKTCPVGKSGEVALSLYYRPQSYLYLGGIVSLAAIFLSLLTLVFWREKRHNGNIAQKEKR
jgi:hypothetical protein